jgi:hypothetical protein
VRKSRREIASVQKNQGDFLGNWKAGSPGLT